ncbi:TolB-like 6-blade propeller-like [Algoriphagus locisalis]|uniref:TolB-like 6-blade propeller-like n=1 Tax=Algoriphagus locisalis TaxID=305507 RepID=A0A1I7D019_9BACT|nr:BF3164 family lipoprotein [Algoriphagus locisalis]SFU05025.1 TolB-like 6-blade propeller-like [Algoriphagus locisalis]
MIIIKDKLVIGDKDDEYYFKVFNVMEEKFEGNLGKIGEGPCEIGFPTFIQAIPNNLEDIGLVLKSNFGYQEMSLLSFDESEETNCKNGIEKIAFDFMNYVKVADSLFVGTGIFQKKYASFKIGEQSYEELAIDYPYLSPEMKSIPNSIPMSQQGKFRIKPDGTSLLFTHSSNPFFDILEIENNNITLKFRMEGEAPDFIGSDSPKSMSAVMTDENKYGFVGSSTTDDFIYLLYSGKTRIQENENYANEIWVFDWDGNLIKKFLLDQEVNQIAVSSNDEFLISYHDDGKPNLTRYDLGGQ